MGWHSGIFSGGALRAVAAGLAVFLLGVAGPPGADAQMPAAEARIDATAEGAQVSGVVEIRGRATDANGGQFSFYRLLVGEGRTPVSLRPLGPAYERPVENGVLGTWDTDRSPSGDYTLALRVYATDGTFATTTRIVTVAYKPTPTPLPIALPGFEGVPTPVVGEAPGPEPTPVEQPPLLDITIDPMREGDPSAPVLAPVPTIAPVRAAVPIQPIPLDPTNPGPFAVDTPTTLSTGQLPGDPAPVYITPIDFNPPSY
jgi:hypothetical protein